ncbi:MAG: PHP domain-containing protein [Nitrososphaerales archaeon]
MPVRIDFHVHTQWSHDAFGDLSEIGKWAKLKGIDVVVITDHNRVTLHKPKIIDSISFVPGIEVKTTYGHVLGVNLQEDLDTKLLKSNPMEAIHKAGGVCILAHPFDSRGKRRREKLKGMDAIEIVNSSTMHLLFNLNCNLSRAYAEALGLPETAGSDSHVPSAVGDAYVEVEGEGLSGAIRSIMEGKGKVFGRPTSMTNRIRLNLLRVTKHKF